jgi:hypothetical protein
MLEILLAPEAGSPKFQLHPVILPEAMLELSVKPVGFPKHTVVEVKLAVGSGCTRIFLEKVSEHPKLFVATSVTTNVPKLLYVWVEFGTDEVLPSPKSHAHCTADPVD